MSSAPRLVSNPPNPWASEHVEWLGDPPPARLEVYEEQARSLLSRNDSPDLWFRWSVNPYRGCFHGCAYCYARPSHQWLGFGAGTDFERRLVVKTNAPEALRRELARPAWRGELIVFSGDTDCYQPLEASYGLTRRCLEVCLEFHNPVAIVTKGLLVRRDAALLGALATRARARVKVSIPFADDATGRKMEPFAPTSTQRFETLRALADAGVPVGIAVAPVIPGLNDGDIPSLLARAREAGATSASMTLLRLPREVLPVFMERLGAAFPPERARRVENAIRDVRGGRLDEPAFGARMRGLGPRWDAVDQLFETHARRLGLWSSWQAVEEPSTFRRPPAPAPPRQGSLFDE